MNKLEKKNNFCTSCGTRINNDDKFCTQCGISLYSDSNPHKHLVSLEEETEQKNLDRHWCKCGELILNDEFCLGCLKKPEIYSEPKSIKNKSEEKPTSKTEFLILLAGIIIFLGFSFGDLIFTSPSKQVSNTNQLFVTEKQPYIVTVKYREEGPVNINDPAFEYQNTSESSFVRGAWYDSSSKYLIMKLKDTHYHYCDFPLSLWDSFKQVNSFGTFYEAKIQGNYSCRYKKVPVYDNTDVTTKSIQKDIKVIPETKTKEPTPEPINGICGSTEFNCSAGFLSNTTEFNGTKKWNCHGLYGGTTTSCSKILEKEEPTDEYQESGCFTSGTQIRLADGTSKDIKDVKTGEKILSSSGPLEVMKKYEIDYEGLLYSINGSKLFVSDSHPFMTTEGWRSFNPEKTKIESPTLEVTKLEIGDILIKEDGEQEVLVEFYSKHTKTKVYNFGLNGTKDFYADGYLVHNVDTELLTVVSGLPMVAKA
jgi:hypothetical protein